jgi:tyrosinase
MVRTLTLVTSAIALTSAVWATPVPDEQLEERQSSGFFAITGVTTGNLPLRYEIRTLQNSHPLQWNLYIQALERFQAQDQSTKASHYGIAGRFFNWTV